MFGHVISKGVEKRQSYPTDLTEQQWNRIEPLIPAVKPGGRPAKYPRREIVSAIFYQMRGGAAWRMLPHDLPPWKITYHYFRVWRKGGNWERIHDQLRGDVREAESAVSSWVFASRLNVGVLDALRAELEGRGVESLRWRAR